MGRRNVSTNSQIHHNFGNLMKRRNLTTDSKIFEFTNAHLDEVVNFRKTGDVGPLKTLYRKHQSFIDSGFDYIRGKIGNVSNSPFLPTYGLLLKCLHVFLPILDSSSSFDFYDKWDKFIRFSIRSGDFSSATGQIRLFMESICFGIKHTASRIPPCDRIHDRCTSILVFELLLAYVKCLCERGTVDVSALTQVVEELDPWLIEFDKDKKRRRWLVEFVIGKIQFDDSEQVVPLFSLILVEHTKVCKNEAMVESGVKLVLKKQRPFLLEVLRYLAWKFPVEAMDESTNELDGFMMQLHWYEESGCLQRTISITIRSIISYHLLEDMLRYNSSDLLRVMALIENARTLREKGGANDCLTNLNRVIDMPHKVDVNKSDHGPSYFMRGQALCLRALCRYEEHDSSPQAFIQDSKAALRMWSENDFVDNNECILQYTTKLLLFVFDVLITIHDKDSHQLLEKILDFFNKSDSKVVKMLWQFKSHHSHISSERFHNILGGGGIQLSLKNYEVLIEEEESTECLERIASDINRTVSWSLESGCLLAQICYDLGERMLMMGHTNEALKYARKGYSYRHRLIKESNMPLQNNQSGGSVYASRVWSLTSEDFLLLPNSIFICYLMSIHQEATILELMGDGTEALKTLKTGKTLSLQRGSSFLVGRFHVTIGKIHRKSQDFELAKEELKKANIQLNRITCGRCKLLLQFEIGKESTKHMRMGVCSPDIKYDSAFAEDRLENDLKNGCKCWEHSCGFSLLSSLAEKGKDYISKDDIRQAETVFLESINLVVSLNSLPSSQSQTKFTNFVKFFEFVERSEIKFSYGSHIALIIYMISWAAYKMSINNRNECGDLFSISIEKLIPSLKRALILSSEVPELFEKVAQLMTIMYFFSHEKIRPSKNITYYEWAAFFHALTVNSGVNYSFSQRLRQVCGDRDPDPDKILNRLTHNGDPELDTFVTQYFEALKPHTVLVMNILGNKYIDLLKTKLKSFPHSECVALMMISRFNPKQKPLVGLFPIKFGPVQKSGDSSRGPWGTNKIVDTIAPELKEIINDLGSQRSLNTIDDRTLTLMSRMESWFDQHQYVLLGEPVGGPMNQNLGYLSGFIGIGYKSYGGKIQGTSVRSPTILVLDKNIQMLPWEGMEAIKDQEFYRMPSVSSIFYTCYKNWEYTKEDSAFSASLDPFHACYVIKPEKSLDSIKECNNESQLANYFKGLGLQGSLWEDVGDVIVEILKTFDLFIYSGHGDGLKYIREGRAALAKLETCAAAILMGCMSGLLILKGPYTPEGAVLDYLLAGSPIVIGNLGTVSAGWALYLYQKLLCICKYKRLMDRDGGEREVGIASCLVEARNNSKRLLVGSNTVCYGVPTKIRRSEVDDEVVM